MRMTWRSIKVAVDINIARHLARALPLGPARLLARILAGFFAPLSLVAWRLMLFGPLHIGLGRMLALGYLRSMGRMERYLFIQKLGRLRTITRFVTPAGTEFVSRARDSGRGILLVSIHTLYSRLLLYWLNQPERGWNPYLVKRFPGRKDKGRAAYLHRHHDSLFGERLIDSGPGIIKAARVLRSGGMVLIAQDVFTVGPAPAIFLGRSVPMPLGAARLAEMTDSLILPVLAAQKSGWKTLIRFWPPIDPRDGGAREKILAVMEEMVTAYPAVWEFWRGYWETAK